MREWTVRVVAVKAFLGNPNNPLIWHLLVTARSASHAIEFLRQSDDIPTYAEMMAYPREL